MPRVTVLREGWIVRDGPKVLDASSSVTLVEAGDHRILVDTGSSANRPALLKSLADACLEPGDIDIVVNTHLHMDHCGCNEMFRDASFHAHPLEAPPLGTVRLEDGAELEEGVRVIHTPGHTMGSVSVFVRSDRRYAICGDALPTRANYLSWVPPAIHADRALAMASMDVIASWAEVVVPGHDNAFDMLGKK